MDPQAVMDAMRARAEARGLSVSCPRCGAGIGKFCLKPGFERHETAADIDVHTERVTLARTDAELRARALQGAELDAELDAERAGEAHEA